jgi:hypothetical protein
VITPKQRNEMFRRIRDNTVFTIDPRRTITYKELINVTA